MPMFDDGSRAEEADMRMIERWCRQAFKSGWKTHEHVTLGGERPTSSPDEQFEEWWRRNK